MPKKIMVAKGEPKKKKSATKKPPKSAMLIMDLAPPRGMPPRMPPGMGPGGPVGRKRRRSY